MADAKPKLSESILAAPDWEVEGEFDSLDTLRKEADKAEKEASEKRILYDQGVRWAHQKTRVLARQKAHPSIVDEWRDRFRGLWLSIPRVETDRRTSLAVVHGLVERADAGSLGGAAEWLEDVFARLLTRGHVSAHEFECSALKLACGLPVLDSERLPKSASALFGVVEEVEDGEARLLMSIPEGETDPTAPIWEACTVPAVDLPKAYAIPGVWVAWVDRTYDCDPTPAQKGRFEPASSLVTVKPPPSLLVETSGFAWTA